jgi:hypothetical protein
VKVLASVSTNAADWVDRSLSLNQARVLVAHLKKVLMLSSGNQHELIASVENSNLNPELVNILTAIIQESPISLTNNLSLADCSIGSPAPFRVLDFDLALEIDELAGSNNLEFGEGTSNEDAYRESFGRFAKLAKQISVLDPYLGHSVLSDKSTDSWLLQQFLKEGCQKFTIVTTLLSSTHRHTLDDPVWMRKKKIVSAIKLMATRYGHPNVDIDVQIYFPDSKVFHNRRIKFSFNSGAIAYVMEKGIAGFASPHMEPEDTLSEISAFSFDRKLKAIQTKMTKVR